MKTVFPHGRKFLLCPFRLRTLFISLSSPLLASPSLAGVIASSNFTDGAAANSFPAVTWTPQFSGSSSAVTGSAYTASSGTIDVGTNGAFIGTYVDQIQADSSNTGDYVWQFIRGARFHGGRAGFPVAPDSTEKFFYVAYGTSSTGAGFTTTPTLSTTFVGTAVTTEPTAPATPAGYTWTSWSGLAVDGTAAGLANRGGKYFHIAFATDSAGAGLSQTYVASGAGATPFIGTYVDTTAVDSTNPARYTWTAISGLTPGNGIAGKDASNATYYFHIKYSQNRGQSFTTNNGEDISIYPAPPGVQTRAINLGADFSAVPAGTTSWSATLATPILTVSNTQTNLGLLNLSFDLQSNRVKEVRVRINSYPAVGSTPSGFIEGVVRPVAVNAMYRYTLDLDQMVQGSALGGSNFNPSATRIQFAFILSGNSVDTAGTWQRVADNFLRIDNVCFTSPSFFAAPSADVAGGNTGLTENSPQTLEYIMDRVEPGDVVCLKPGTYTSDNGRIIPFGAVAGTPSRWITVRSFDKSNPAVLRTLRYNAVEIWCGSAYVDLRNLNFRGYYDGEGGTEASLYGLSIQAASENGAKVNTFPGQETNPAYTVFTDHNLSTTQRYIAPFSDAYGNLFTAAITSKVPVNVKPFGPIDGLFNASAIYFNGRLRGTGLGTAVRAEEYEAPHHIRVADCVITNYPGPGISSTRSDYLYIENNAVVANNRLGNFGGSGISSLTPVNFDGSNLFRHFILANTSADNGSNVRWGPRVSSNNGIKTIRNEISDGNGIIMDSWDDYDYLGRSLISNNVVYDNAGGGIHNFQAENITVVNNTAFYNGKPGISTGFVSTVQVSTTPHFGAANQAPYATYNTTNGKAVGVSLNYGEIDTQGSKNVLVHNNVMWANDNLRINGPIAAGSNVTYSNNLFGRDGGFTDAQINGGTNPAVFTNNAVSFSLTTNKLLKTTTAAGSVFANSTNPSLATFLRLRNIAPISPAINAGAVNSFTPLDDRVGTRRPGGAAVDMGAYEVP